MSKRDEGKAPVQLIQPEFVFGLAGVLKFGADKYGPNDWKKNKGVEGMEDRTFGSVQRHLWSWEKGERFDKESGMNHLLHAACQLMMLYWYTDCQEREASGGADENELRS